MALGRARLGGTRFGRIVMVGLALAASASLLAACDSGNGSSSSDTIPVVTPSTAPYTYRKLRVNVRISGTHTLTIDGVAGQCRFPAAGLPVAYIVSGVPQLGSNGSIIVWGPTAVPGTGTIPPNVKSLINGSGVVSANSGQGVNIRPDLQSVDLNATMSGPLVGAGGVVQGWATDTITGTLRCI